LPSQGVWFIQISCTVNVSPYNIATGVTSVYIVLSDTSASETLVAPGFSLTFYNPSSVSGTLAFKGSLSGIYHHISGSNTKTLYICGRSTNNNSTVIETTYKYTRLN
jgi:hypothetical protein